MTSKPRKPAAVLSPAACAVLERRYLRKDADGQVIETFEDMLRRVTCHAAQAEKQYGCDPQRWAERFYDMMADLRFLPNSPCFMNAGTKLGQLAACFVLPVEDSLEAIFTALKETALIHKSGGGTGFSFSRLRPSGDVVASTCGVASGPLSFLWIFDAATHEIKQGGRRRGANMGILRVDHPDILQFIQAKSEVGVLENFNLSVAVTNEIMEKACAGEDYDLVNPRTAKPSGRLNAEQVLDAIAQEAWRTGEPGLLFLDAVNEANPTPRVGQIEATNPCGEQPLLPYESCVLGSINLARMATAGGVDWRALRDTAQLAVRFLDDVIDVNHYPLAQIEHITRGNRKIGLGVMGFADLLFALGVPYDCDEALELGEKLMAEVSGAAREVSERLADERGPFPNFKRSIYDKSGAPKLRNATRTTIAPTGTLSLIAGVSSGIEPNFALAYNRKVGDGSVTLVNPVFERVARQRGFYTPGLVEDLLKNGAIKDGEGIPEEVRRVFATALEVSPEWHVRMQAAFQKHTDNAVSKTINLPTTAGVDVVKEAFLMTWRLGCKGLTVYRDGSRPQQVLAARPQRAPRSQPRERPEKTTGMTKKARVGCGNLYITVNRDDQGLCEVFTVVGRAGGCPSQSEAASRLVSIALRAGVEPDAIVEQLRGIRCHSTVAAKKTRDGAEVLSCPDAIGRTIAEFMNHGDNGADLVLPQRCPDCGNKLEQQNGRCVICRSCGFSRCF
ncbi:vitamin B12-dependent ribonucleotide reductase [Candidatus Sumerlaeota bacterium]|nr:vitamin B12-dependent ribonucleotide reductase [Candidatus Sumerlaeota bacterium]